MDPLSLAGCASCSQVKSSPLPKTLRLHSTNWEIDLPLGNNPNKMDQRGTKRNKCLARKGNKHKLMLFKIFPRKDGKNAEIEKQKLTHELSYTFHQLSV